MQRTDVVDDEFDESVRCLVKFLPHPFCAYNSSFEESWLGVKFELDLFKRWKLLSEKMDNQGTHSRWPSLSDLIAGPYAAIGKSDILGLEVPVAWSDHLKTRDFRLLRRIVDHNYFDLLRDCSLLLWDDASMLALLPTLIHQSGFT